MANMMHWEELEKLMGATSILALQDTEESWRAADALIDYLISFSEANISGFSESVSNFLRSEKGPLRDLGATFVSKLDTKYTMPWMEIRIVPKSEVIDRGIYDTHPYAQLRAVIAAVEHDWLPDDKKGHAISVLSKHKEEMPDVVTPYLEKLA